MPISAAKQWAREHMKGLENCTIPSFSLDLKQLDEEGIRWDVRQAIRHGFYSTQCTAEVGLTFEEAKRFVEVVADEAKGKIHVSTTLFFDSVDQNIEMLKHAEKVGCSSALLGYPANFNPKSEEEIYQITRDMCDSARIPIVLYACHKYNFERFHPSGYPLGLLNRLADIENVVGLKIGHPDSGFVFDCFERVGDRILVSCAATDLAPLLRLKYGQQWAGAAVFEMFQSPEKPYMVEYFDLLLKGEMDRAMEIHWRITPVRMLFMSHMTGIVLGSYHWSMFKYHQWLVGGNGGFTRKPVLKMFFHEMMNAKMALRAVGIEPRENDAEFYVGRVNYARMGG